MLPISPPLGERGRSSRQERVGKRLEAAALSQLQVKTEGTVDESLDRIHETATTGSKSNILSKSKRLIHGNLGNMKSTSGKALLAARR